MPWATLHENKVSVSPTSGVDSKGLPPIFMTSDEFQPQHLKRKDPSSAKRNTLGTGYYLCGACEWWRAAVWHHNLAEHHPGNHSAQKPVALRHCQDRIGDIAVN